MKPCRMTSAQEEVRRGTGGKRSPYIQTSRPKSCSSPLKTKTNSSGLEETPVEEGRRGSDLFLSGCLLPRGSGEE